MNDSSETNNEEEPGELLPPPPQPTEAKPVEGYPRLLNFFGFVVVPLLCLIGLSFLFGHFLAFLEKPGEMEANDNALRERFQIVAIMSEVKDRILPNVRECIVSHNNTIENGNNNGNNDNTTLVEYMEVCLNPFLDRTNETFDEISRQLFGTGTTDLSFHWARCSPVNQSNYFIDQQIVLTRWLANWEQLFFSYQAEGFSTADAYYWSVGNATGTDECTVNTAGGAFFWFTIMTTIGYGNTAPVTVGGRAMVYTLGFLSILLFTAVSGQAGYVSLLVFDDFFARIPRLSFLQKGWWACAFWLVAYYSWGLVTAGLFLAYAKIKAAADNPYDFADAFWWAYISTTTVGFGDIYINHEIILARDMFFIPFFLLFGFVLLANFLLKLAETFWERMPKPKGLTDFEKTLENERNNIRIMKEEQHLYNAGAIGGRGGVRKNPYLEWADNIKRGFTKKGRSSGME